MEDDEITPVTDSSKALNKKTSSAQAQTSMSTYELPWVEKYRPKVLDHVVGNGPVIDRLKVIAKHGNMPNFLLSGPPGCGKTTAILCLARQLLGEEHAKTGILELNASDDRGIDVVRTKIKMFAQKKLNLPPGVHKLVILDEADSMTEAAQQAMRRTMEIYSESTRFALACNLSSKIIEPIQSRCAVIRFRNLSDKEVMRRLMYVFEREVVQCDDGGYEALVFTAEGDMRHALNNAQSTYNGFGSITSENVFKVCDQPSPVILTNFLNACQGVDLDTAVNQLKKLWDDGYPALDIVQTIFRLLKYFEMDEASKLEFFRLVGSYHMRITNGTGSLLQLTGLAAELCGLNLK